MTWTRFMDMHSGGSQKEEAFSHLLIEASEDEAKRVFYARFGHNPERVTCTCCGEDYSIDEHLSVEAATAYDRGCPYLEDERGLKARGERDFREGFYLEPGEEVPEGMRVSDLSSLRSSAPVPIDAFLADPQAHGYEIIRAIEIKPEERTVDVSEEGYVWAGG